MPEPRSALSEDHYYSREWKELLHEGVDWDSLLPLYYPEFPTPEGIRDREELLAFFDEVLTKTGDWGRHKLEPRAAEVDRIGAGRLENGKFVPEHTLRQTLREVDELGLITLCLSREHGGMGVPLVVGMAAFTHLARGCFATSAQLAFNASFADMLDRFAPREIADRFIPKIGRGELSGSMCLTEPDVGSDLGNLRTTAVRQEDGSYRIHGSKRFITNAGGGLALILARVAGAPGGLGGISLFFAEQYPDGMDRANYEVTRIEEKCGLHGSATCEVIYENTRAFLVGRENEGFKLMLHLMNEARISVGLQSVAIMEASIDKARKYAKSRVQFGKPLAELPLYARNLADLETERDALRAFLIDTVSWFDQMQKLDLKARRGKLTDAEKAQQTRVSRVVRRRTPLVKAYASERAADVVRKCVQAFGGYGYMREYEIERAYRDVLAPLLYEGTTQIQSLMALKDFVKDLVRNPRRFVAEASWTRASLAVLGPAGEMQRSVLELRSEFYRAFGGVLLRVLSGGKDTESSLTHLARVLLSTKLGKELRIDRVDLDPLLIHAETLLMGLATLEILEVLAAQAAKIPARAELFARYLRLARPRMAALVTELTQQRQSRTNESRQDRPREYVV